tara:strand:- start:3610 stop:5466 length:1857 start_codon:yes stop_codon:yes gene_type:complete
MSLAFFLGAVKGAADKNAENLQLSAKNNQSLTERMTEGENNYNAVIADPNTLYHMHPFIQLASNRTPFSINIENRQENSKYVQAIQNSEYSNGRPNFSVTRTTDPIVNIGKLVEYDVGYQFSHLRNDENELGDDVRRWETATIATLARMFSNAEVKELQTGNSIARTPIHNQIPGWDTFTPQRKQYYNDLIARAAGLTLSEAEAMNLVNPTGIRTPSVQEDEDENIRLVPQKFPNTDGTFTSISDIPEEITTALTGVAKSRRDDASVFVANTLQDIHSMNQAKGLSYQEGSSTVQYLNSQFTSNRITENGGVFYSTPSDQELIKQQTKKVYDQVGMGDFISLTAAAIPEEDLYKLDTIPPGGYNRFKSVRRDAYEALVIGIKGSDQRKKFNTKTQDLTTLKSNINDFLTVMENGAQIGYAQNLVLFKDGATAFATAIHNMFSNDADYINQFGKNGLDDFLNQVQSLTKTGQLTQIALFLEKQLAYSVARALESTTGNARLSNIDVELARQSLGLSGMFAAPQNAKAVLTLLRDRTQRELEYQTALGSRNLRTMQAAQYAQGLYGADSMLRVASVDNQAAAYAAFRKSLEQEAQRVGVTLPEIQARRGTGRVDDGNPAN